MDKRIQANLLVKRSLSDALFDLLVEKGIGSVGISELVARAGVSRSSFYRNFDSIDDVLVYGSELIVDEFFETCPYEILDFSDFECVLWQLGFWQEHASQIVTLSHSGLAHTCFGHVFEIGMQGLEDEEDDSQVVVERRFAIGAFHALALHWIEDGTPGSKEELAHRYCGMLAHGIGANR